MKSIDGKLSSLLLLNKDSNVSDLTVKIYRPGLDNDSDVDSLTEDESPTKSPYSKVHD